MFSEQNSLRRRIRLLRASGMHWHERHIAAVIVDGRRRHTLTDDVTIHAIQPAHCGRAAATRCSASTDMPTRLQV